jgi:hypothetical protein
VNARTLDFTAVIAALANADDSQSSKTLAGDINKCGHLETSIPGHYFMPLNGSPKNRMRGLMPVSTIYTPPWQMSMKPYLRGYTILLRADRWEIWHYATDRLRHVTKTWAEAKAWVEANPGGPKRLRHKIS